MRGQYNSQNIAIVIMTGVIQQAVECCCYCERLIHQSGQCSSYFDGANNFEHSNVFNARGQYNREYSTVGSFRGQYNSQERSLVIVRVQYNSQYSAVVIVRGQ